MLAYENAKEYAAERNQVFIDKGEWQKFMHEMLTEVVLIVRKGDDDFLWTARVCTPGFDFVTRQDGDFPKSATYTQYGTGETIDEAIAAAFNAEAEM